MSREHPFALHRLAIAALVIALAAVLVLAVRGPVWWQRTYHPLSYEALIARAAAEHGVDPYLIAAVINAESSFDAGQVSEAGAVGLMQVMPLTATEAAAEGGLGVATDVEALKAPALNIDLGTRHLASLLSRYGDTATALAAYNAGEGNVDRWIEGSGGGDVLASSYPETRRYVERVLKERDRYEKLYPDAFDAAGDMGDTAGFGNGGSPGSDQ